MMRNATKGEIVKAVRASVKGHKARGDIPAWRYTVSAHWSGMDIVVVVKADPGCRLDETTRRWSETRLIHAAKSTPFYRDDSRAEFDHFDTSYYVYVQFLGQ